MADEKWSPSKLVLVAVTASITATVTYGCNSWFARDKLTVEAVEFYPALTQYAPSREAVGELRGNFEFAQWSSFQPEAKVQVLEDLDSRGLDAERRESLLGLLSDFIAFGEKRLSQLDAFLKEWKTPMEPGKRAELKKEARKLKLTFSVPPFISEVPDREIEPAVQNSLDSLRQALRRAGEIHAEGKAFSHERTGGMSIHVTLLNSGNTDSLVKKDGELILPESSLRFPIHLYEELVQKVEKRSLVAVWFMITEGKTPPADLAKLQALIKSKSPIKGLVELKDFRDGVIQSGASQFPPEDR